MKIRKLKFIPDKMRVGQEIKETVCDNNIFLKLTIWMEVWFGQHLPVLATNVFFVTMFNYMSTIAIPGDDRH